MMRITIRMYFYICKHPHLSNLYDIEILDYFNLYLHLKYN